jgi:hypothetical protein
MGSKEETKKFTPAKAVESMSGSEKKQFDINDLSSDSSDEDID